MALGTKTKAWLYGMGSAGIGAAAHSLGVILVAPDRFNLTTKHGAHLLAESCLVSAAAAVALTLAQSPLPEWDWVQSIRKTRKDASGQPEVIQQITAGTGAPPEPIAPAK